MSIEIQVSDTSGCSRCGAHLGESEHLPPYIEDARNIESGEFERREYLLCYSCRDIVRDASRLTAEDLSGWSPVKTYPPPWATWPRG